MPAADGVRGLAAAHEPPHELTIDDGPGQPPLVAATLPWQCEGTELRVP